MKRLGIYALSIGLTAMALAGCRGFAGGFLPPSSSAPASASAANPSSSNCIVSLTAAGTSYSCPATPAPVFTPQAPATPLPTRGPLPIVTQAPTPSPTLPPTPVPTLPPTPTPTLPPTPIPTQPPAPLPTQPPSVPPTTNATPFPVTISFYSYVDNNNATQIYYPQSQGYPTPHNAAGGSGTYSDPVTMAASHLVFSPGTRLYVYALSKYVVMEDYCGVCENDWSWSQKVDMQVWIGGNSASSNAALAQCETSLTAFVSQSNYAGLVLPNPPANGLLVNTTPLFNISTSVCY